MKKQHSFPGYIHNVTSYSSHFGVLLSITLESGINIRVRLLIFEGFSRGYVVIKGGYFYWFFIFKKLFKNFWLSFPTLSRVTLLSHFNSKTISLWTRQSQLTIRSQMAWALKFSMLVVPKTNLTFYIQNC